MSKAFGFKKFVNFFDNGFRTVSVIGVFLTVGVIVIVKVFDIKLSDQLRKIPFMDQLINIELVEKFENIDPEDEFYIQLQNNIGAFVEDSSQIAGIKVRVDSEQQKTFRITMKDWEQKYVSINKDGDIFLFDKNEITFQNVFSGNYIGWESRSRWDTSSSDWDWTTDSIAKEEVKTVEVIVEKPKICPPVVKEEEILYRIKTASEQSYVEWKSVWYDQWYTKWYEDAKIAFGYGAL